jgi:hypothetical protein
MREFGASAFWEFFNSISGKRAFPLGHSHGRVAP